MQDLAAGPFSATLRPAAAAALTVATTTEQAATAVFFSAVAAAIGGDAGEASGLLAQARRLDSGQSPTWIGWLAEAGQRHPAVLPMISALTRPPEDPQNTGEDASAGPARTEPS